MLANKTTTRETQQIRQCSNGYNDNILPQNV